MHKIVNSNKIFCRESKNGLSCLFQNTTGWSVSDTSIALQVQVCGQFRSNKSVVFCNVYIVCRTLVISSYEVYFV
jgi:hypothetical protein